MYKVEHLEPVTMRYDPDSLAIQKLEECADHLVTVCQHADRDCPSEYKTKWFNPSIQDAYEFVGGLYEQGILQVDTGKNQEELVSHVMAQVDGMSFDEKDDFNLEDFLQVACKELGWEIVPQTSGFKVTWEYSVQINGVSTTFSERELLDLAEKHNVPDWLIKNFDDRNPTVFTYTSEGRLCGEHQTKTPLIHLMNWIERESDGHYTFYA